MRATKLGEHPCGAGGGGAVLPGGYGEANAVMADSVFEPQLHGGRWCAPEASGPSLSSRLPGGWLVGGDEGARCRAGCCRSIPVPSASAPGEPHWERDGLL